MNLLVGFLLIFCGALFQGSFILPMTLVRGWKWEHTWAAFSLLGMLVFNLVIGVLFLPHLWQAVAMTPARDLGLLLGFGALWGTGAILFGKGMEKLGMAVGYPVIMGLILGLGALLPLLQKGIGVLASRSGLLLIVGTAVVIVGILLCSRASSRKDAKQSAATASSTRSGMVIAVWAGILSGLPNVGLSNATHLTTSAMRMGASAVMAPNAAWVVMFTAGFLVNFSYCILLIVARKNVGEARQNAGRNIVLVALMSALWIGSFYLYGIGAARVGTWGPVVGWPLFISLAIVAGNLWGLWRGEWKAALPAARAQLNLGLLVILAAVALFGVSANLR